MDKNKVTVFEGVGSFESATKIKNYEKMMGLQRVLNPNIPIIATVPSHPHLPFITIDKERIITSTEALGLQEVPKKNY